MAYQMRKVMAATLPEFHRSLARFLPDLTLQDGQTEFRWVSAGRTLSIDVVELPGRTMGGILRLPQMDVTIELDGYDDTERDALLAEFDLAFQRGGG